MNLRSFFNRFRLKNLRISSKLGLIIAVFSAVICILLALSIYGLNIINDVRAYIAGKTLWANARQEASASLGRYVLFRDEKYYQQFLQNLNIPLGDRQGFLELMKAAPDLEVARRGFAMGGIYPADIDRAVLLFLRYRWTPFMSAAISEWQKADTLIIELAQIGSQIHDEVQKGPLSHAKVRDFLNRIEEMGIRIGIYETAFDNALAKGAQALIKILVGSMTVAAVLLLTLGILIARKIAHNLMTEIHGLQHAASKIAEGDFKTLVDVSPRDEIGDLARRFKEMARHREEVEQILSERARELDEANKIILKNEKIKDEFFANVSHELRTPLTLILSPLESLLSGAYGVLQNEAQEQAAKTMHNNAVRLLQMVTGLLDFSKLEAGKIQVSREPVHIVTLTKAILEDFRPMVEQRGIRLAFEEEPAELTVAMDRYLYDRILFNLLSNAVKFTPAGGEIRLTLKHQDDRLTVSVRDTGIGISEKDREHLFQKFRQIEGSSTRRFEGTGLGLALVREFSRLLGGTVSVESKEGEGSTFAVDCLAPRTDRETAAENRTGSQFIQKYVKMPIPEAQRLKVMTEAQPKILIAEDNLELASYMTSLIYDIGQMKIAQDGEEALGLVRQWKPDLVISDVMMPRRDGFSLCREIKSDPATAAIPVVLLTALTYREALLKGWEAGADEYLFKPFHPKEFLTRIRSILSIFKARQEAEEKVRETSVQLAKSKTELEQLELFSFAATHDLQEPLKKILLLMDLLKRDMPEPISDENRNRLARMEKACLRMVQMMEDLRELARIGKVPVFESLDLNKIAAEVLLDLDLTISEAKAEISVGDLPVMEGAPVQIYLLFLNLILNAVKFRRPGEPLRIGVSGTAADNDFVEITVADNGIGFSEEYAERIFKPFQRLQPEKYEGTGMGLAICQKIALRHGGTITAKSREGEGTVFVVRLKKTQVQAAEPANA